MEDISKEEILSTINNNIKEYDLMYVKRFVNTFREELLKIFNLFNKVPQEAYIVSMAHSMCDVQAEVLHSVSMIDMELYKELYAIYSGNDDKRLFWHIADEENPAFNDDKCMVVDDEFRIMQVTFDYNAMDYARLAHESGHILSVNRTNTNRFLLAEIESTFLEKLVIRDLVKRGVLTDYDNEMFRLNDFAALAPYITNVVSQTDVLNMVRYPVEAEDLVRVHNYYEGKPNDVYIYKAILDLTQPDSLDLLHYTLRYIIGEVVSYYMVKQYESGDVEIVERYKEFLKNSNDETVNEVCKKLIGMDFNQAISNYVKDIALEMEVIKR